MNKIMFKKGIQRKLEKYVRKYFETHPDIKLITVAGSVGKTSTKLAIATILSQKYRVRLHEGNHNTHLSAPLAILGINFPGNPRNFLEWHRVFRAARRRIKSPSDQEPQIIIQELGTDRPGDIERFSKYLAPNIAVITSVTPEHMEFFGSIDAVAQEELEAASFARMAILNQDDISPDFFKYVRNSNIATYSSVGGADYNFIANNFSLLDGFSGKIQTPEYGEINVRAKVFGEHSLRPITGAVAVSIKLGLSPQEIVGGLASLKPVPGRMNFMRGVKDSVLIDDTYNSSPAALEAAIQTLYSLSAPSKIAVIGSMNELGEASAFEHQKIGKMLDGISLSWVVTVGEHANKFLAPAARLRGCQVYEAKNAIDAGTFVHKIMERGTLVLLKGSQGKIYLEEATKILLLNKDDEKWLVRQDEKWKKTKDDFFSSFTEVAEDEV
ncbi:MAG: Mur ligase family protein [Candidatus Nanogingivalis sp.]|jgi:UDP-N-acetylmuramoyl-tripeptide--D-alanyl-D-alanine ligase (fragment)